MKTFSLIFISLTLITGQAGGNFISPHQAMMAAMNLLKKEIKRDEEILSTKMNIQRLNATREKLTHDMPEKEKVIKGLLKANRVDAGVLKALEDTLKNEKRISGDTRKGEVIRIRAQRLLRVGFNDKKSALIKAKKWLKR